MPPTGRGLNAEGLLGIFYALDFGATGDGQHDDSGGIQAAILAAGASGGGLVAIPAGTYRLGSNVAWGTAANVTIWQHSGATFAGPGSLPAAAGSNAIRAEPSGATVGGVPVTQAFGDVAAAGASGVAADSVHRHGMPANVTTANLAAGAASQNGLAVGVASNPTTTSTTYVDLPDMTVTLTTVGGDVKAWLAGDFYNNTAATVVQVGLSLDAAAEVGSVRGSHATVNGAFALAALTRFAAPAAGAHTVKARWLVGGGTGTADLTNRTLLVEEAKR